MLEGLIVAGKLQAQKGETNYKHVCYIVSRNTTIVSCAVNKYNSKKSTCHAEEYALKNMNTKIRKKDIYIFRFKEVEGEWVLRNSKPCVDCTLLIKKSGIRRVYYSFHNNQESGVVKTKASTLESNHISHGRKRQTKNKTNY